MTRRTAVEWRSGPAPAGHRAGCAAVEPTGRTGRLQVLRITTRRRRVGARVWVASTSAVDCPSRVIALSLLSASRCRRGWRTWSGWCRGAVKRDSAVDRQAEREALDGLPGCSRPRRGSLEPRRPR
ncbi:hypothetical protein HBB16_05030 [Pseudonocardia sp. MCCB 268]|nr:hypothetical protein [Pseudonocardia cytotoxica]